MVTITLGVGISNSAVVELGGGSATKRDKKMLKIAISASFQKKIIQTIYCLVVFMTYVTTFDSKTILWERTFHTKL